MQGFRNLTMKGKKSITLADMYPAVLAIIVLGIALGVGLFVLDQTTDAIASTSTTVVNETLTTLTESGEVVDTADECGFTDFTVLIIQNATGAETVPTTNYTTRSDGYVFYIASAGQYNNSNVNVTYTYEGSGDATWCTSIDTTTTGLSGLASWIAVIVVVIAAAIVLGIVINSFTNKRSAI